MKKQSTVNIAGRFEAEALRILREVSGLDVAVEDRPDDLRADAIIRFAGGTASVAVEAKARVSAATAWGLVRRAETHPDVPLLLVAGRTTAEARRILAEHGVAVVDGLGNAHIELPGLLVHLEGRPGARPEAKPAGRHRLRGKAGIVAQALLLHPDRAWQVQGLAKEASVSAALAHNVLVRLEDEGLVRSEGSGPRRVRRVLDPTALLDLWVEEAVDRSRRTPAYVLARTSGQLMDDMGSGLRQAGIAHALTGPAGASFVAPFVTSIRVVEVWVTATVGERELAAATGADPVSDGQNIVFLQAKDDGPLAFREQASGQWIANRFRLYADLRSDPRRGREQAEHLRQEVIGF